jgi:hypothetical protein
MDKPEILPLSFTIGTLADIAEIFPIEHAKELRLTQNNNR